MKLNDIEPRGEDMNTFNDLYKLSTKNLSRMSVLVIYRLDSLKSTVHMTYLSRVGGCMSQVSFETSHGISFSITSLTED